MQDSQDDSQNLKTWIAHRIQERSREIWDWTLSRAREFPPPFYCSVDLRDSGHKIVPVDSNLYPAGFNNICPDDLRAGRAILRSHVEAAAAHQQQETPRKILILPESHTSNLYYLENLHYLRKLVSDAGFEVQVGWYGPVPEGFPSPLQLKSVTHKKLTLYPIRIENRTLHAGEFIPDLILLNNDFSGGYPKELDQVDQSRQMILPSYSLGWHSRKKTDHFKYYNRLAREFAEIIEVDPWIFQIETEEVTPVDFSENLGIESVATAVERILEHTRLAYEARGISRKPVCFVKNNAGTYGIGVMTVHSADEIRKMNRREKNKMSVGKGKVPIQSVAVQEGIPTATIVSRLAAEPVIYLMGCHLVGGFLRTNQERGDEENLNSSGMVFRKLCMSDLRTAELKPEYPIIEPESELPPAPSSNALSSNDQESQGSKEPVLELVYGAVARLSALATGMELADHRA